MMLTFILTVKSLRNSENCDSNQDVATIDMGTPEAMSRHLVNRP